MKNITIITTGEGWRKCSDTSAARTLLCGLRCDLKDAGLMKYADADRLYAVTRYLDSLLDNADDTPADPRHPAYHGHDGPGGDVNALGTRPEWRTHGTVVVSLEDADTSAYATDPAFLIPGSHYVWTDGLGCSGTGTWVQIENYDLPDAAKPTA